jgi:heparan-alpha-glucosaminide N-acetyltransferase
MMPFPTLEESGKTAANKAIPSLRIASIDIVRALTMLLMIFVNDLGSLHNIPEWLEHVAPGVDGMGLADSVFPAFLFIVGLSLPFAIGNRRKKGDTDAQLVWHVIQRTVALLVMGVFLVNGETFNAPATGIPYTLWTILCCISFILIWNLYPKNANKILVTVLKILGAITLVILAFIYHGGDNGQTRFGPQWWGILGLIGWSYLAAGIVTIFARNKFWVLLGAWAFFCILSMAYKAGIVPHQGFLSFIPSPILGGTLTGLTLGGVLTSNIFQYFRKKHDNKNMTLVFLGFAILLIVLSVITRPYWKLAKLGATPAWLFLCSALTILLFTAVYWIADVYKKANWFNIIKPGGTDTLLCYLVPYFVYSILHTINFHWPEAVVTGGTGLLKSFLLALLCINIGGWLNKIGIKLKL